MSSKTTRFEHLLEAVPDALVAMDQKGLIRFVNCQTESLFGYQRDRLVGEPIETLIPEPLWQIYAEHQQTHFADPRTRSLGLDLELSGRHQDGTEFPINVSLSHIDTGDVLLVITAVHDVNRRRQAVRNAELVASIVEYSDDAIMSANLEGTITTWNPAAERLYGYSAKDVIGRYASFLMPPERAGDITRLFDSVRGGQAIDRFETVRLRKDGVELPVSITISPIRDEDGEMVGATAIHRDISQQRQAFETAQRMATIVENSDDAIIGETPEGIITSWNPAAERMFGYSDAEIIGKSVSLLIPRDVAAQAKALAGKVSTGQQIKHVETLNVRRDGTIFPVSLTISPIRDEGTVVGASVICRDITGQQKAFVTAQYMAAIVENSEDAIISGSLDGLVTSWNPAAERMYGYSANEVVGKPARFLTPQDRKDEIRAVLRKIKAGQHVERLETKRIRKDGTAFPVALTVSPILDPAGAVVGTSVIHRDLSEQKGALAVAQRIAAIVENSHDAIFGMTIDGTITSWNPAAERMFGYPAKEIIGTAVDRLIPDERKGELLSFLAKISAGQSIDDYETVRVRKDGTAFSVSLTISSIRDEHRAVVGASVICRDVTELKHAAQYARSLIEAALDPLVTISAEGKITDVNDASVKAIGIPRHQLVGTDFAQYFTDPAKANRGYQQAFGQGSVTDLPLTLRHRDGTLTDVLYNASVYRDICGKVIGVFAAARDMTEQRPRKGQPD